MTDNENTTGYGVVNDEDSSFAGNGGNYGHFGLNQNCFFTEFCYNPNAGSNGAAGEAIDFTIKVGEKEYRRRIFDVVGALYGANNTLVQPTESGYKELADKAKKQLSAVIVHALKSLGITQEVINSKFTTPVANFQDWATRLMSLVPSNLTSIPIDIFLHYQWKISEGQNKTYLEIPKNLKDGKFLCPAIKAVFKEVRDNQGLYYIDENNQNHLFERSASFLTSPKAVRQVVEMETKNINNADSQKSAW